ncbi:uncharacterized protein BP5553_00705 [Venustampulla echinocandica]|uniref:Uncharacterized protein n=1 Tax=Venustampulla echinocandica TaxID=2656787 RepID=A0A370TYW7_9HELO|nr:uncharacterized protein BP5553_00705 [Venustampulla echinocandica]RDL40726.1 hypothetical protein BP5553_00705 [Venustampulla echinocandica]
MEQSQRPGIKRPWDEGITLSGRGDTWNGTGLPPIDRRPALPHGGEAIHDPRNHYPRESTELEAKRPRYVRDEHQHSPGDNFGVNGQMLHSRVNHTIYDPKRISHGTTQSPQFASKQRVEGWGNTSGRPGQHVEPRESTNLCRRCRKAITERPDGDSVESDERYATILRTTASELMRLVGTLSQRIPYDDRYGRGMPRLSPDRPSTAEDEYPPVEQFGLEHTLNWMLNRVHHINRHADRLVQEIPPDTFQRLKTERSQNGMQSSIDHADIMNRGLDTERESAFRLRVEPSDPAFDGKLYTRDTVSVKDDPSPVRSPYNYHPSQSSDGSHGRLSTMNPPLASTRQLPSPPGRSVSSPTSASFPSPSAGSFGSTSQPANVPTPLGLQPSSPNIYLPPIGSARSSDSALQAHSAALQHDVSVQKIALSSLQAEHDKLLAAYLRSQTRSSALEKKHSVSDAEIITLTEEKLRLQTQVLDLEKDIEDISRSRDECRQSAVQEGAQYLEIVKKASQLEAMAVGEKQRWDASKKELEQRIQELKTGSGSKGGLESVGSANPTSATSVDGMEKPASLQQPLNIFKLEDTGGERAEVSTMAPESANGQRGSVRVLEEEIQHLRHRCAELEKCLHEVRAQNRSMDGLVDALVHARKSMLEQADKALQE